MLRLLAALALLLPAAATTPIQPGRWEVTSKAVELTVPGAPGFLMRMARGKTRTEKKCINPAQAEEGIAALLVPDPKARCTVESQRVADGRFTQQLSCPQKKGGPNRVTRTGSYTATGFTGRLEVNGETPKGKLHIVVDQTARRTAACG